MPRQIGGRTYYTTSEACQGAGVSRSTLLRWMNGGLIPDAALRDRNGWRLFSEDDISSIRCETQKVTANQIAMQDEEVVQEY